jgi:hypothetical protein
MMIKHLRVKRDNQKEGKIKKELTKEQKNKVI